MRAYCTAQGTICNLLGQTMMEKIIKRNVYIRITEFTVLYCRNRHNTVNQLYFDYKIKTKQHPPQYNNNELANMHSWTISPDSFPLRRSGSVWLQAWIISVHSAISHRLEGKHFLALLNFCNLTNFTHQHTHTSWLSDSWACKHGS